MGKSVGVRALRLVAISAAILAGATGVAFATGTLGSIVGADGTIAGCYLKDTGQLRVVETAAACRSNELRVTWSQQGPEGATGETGPAGADGTSVTSSALPEDDGHCPGGGVALHSASGTSYVCNGADGKDGEDGPPGPPGETGCGLETRIKSALPSFELSPECVPPPAEGDVCNDGNASTYDDRIRDGVCAGLPGSPEVCDGLDNDLNGSVDDNIPPQGVPNGAVHCTNGHEQLTCNAGFANGDGQLGNGCETNLMTDPANCGALGHAVFIPNGTGGCVGGQAVIVSCNAGFFDADGSVLNGCEFHEDSFEQNDTQATARPVGWGSLNANIAPAGDEDWYRYTADCSLFDPCTISFLGTASAFLQVYEDGSLLAGGPSVAVGSRITPHVYLVRVVGSPFSTYTLNAVK